MKKPQNNSAAHKFFVGSAMINKNNKNEVLKVGLLVRDEGVGGSNPLIPTIQ